MFLGNAQIIEDESSSNGSGGNNLFILDHQTDEVLGHINQKYVIDNEHEKDLPTHKDYFRFTVLADNKHAEHLTKRNVLIIPGEDGEFLEFRIFESIKYRNNEGLFIQVHALATYLDLKTQKIFDPQKTTSETALQHATTALDGTEWQVGNVEFKGVRTLDFDSPFNSYDYILRIAREFELEPRFYIETDGNKITGRYVDLVERVGEFRGRTIEFGRDLQSIKRKEDTSEVVTALWVYGPQREDGTRLKVLVEDDEARQRWGRRGRHIIDYYEPQTDDQNITQERLETLGNMELNKRINAVVTYEADIVDLENVPGLENKKIRFGDTIRIKDMKFNPPLYVEARVFNVKRDVFNKANKTVQLGDFVEYTEEEVQAIWKLLQQQIQQKISAAQAEQIIEEYAEPKKVESPTPPPIVSEGDNPIWIDTSKDPHVPHIVEQGQWVKVVPTEAEEVNAYNKSEIDTITSELEDGIQQAMSTADGKNTVFRQENTPPTTNRKVGDLWFKTDEGNKMFVWTGEWTETKLDYQALSVGKLSAISADLGDVTAGNITGVTMNLANGKFVVDENGDVWIIQSDFVTTGIDPDTSEEGKMTIQAGKIELEDVNNPDKRRSFHAGRSHAYDRDENYIYEKHEDITRSIYQVRNPADTTIVNEGGISIGPIDFLIDSVNAIKLSGTRIKLETLFDTGLDWNGEIQGIVEHDANANGEYIRFANGMQICFLNEFRATTSSSGGLAANWTYPAAFISAPFTYATVNSSNYINYGVTVQRPTNSQATFRGYGLAADTQYTLSSFAIGRWR